MTSHIEQPTSDHSQTAQYNAERLKFLCTHTQKGILVALIAVIVVAYTLWHEVPHNTLLIWTGLGVLINIFRLMLARKHLKMLTQSDQHQHIETLTTWVTALMGILWSASVFLFFPIIELQHEAFIAFMIGGMAAGAIPVLSASMRVFSIYILTSLIPLITYCFMQSDSIHLSLGIMISIFALVAWSVGNHFHKALTDSITMHQEKSILIKQAKQINLDLKHEMSERKKVESELAASEYRASMILDHAQVGISVIQDGKVAFSNPYSCRTMGYTEDEIMGMPLVDIVHPDDFEASKERMIDVLTHQNIHTSYAIRYIDKQGRAVHAETSAMPITYHDKPAVLVVILNTESRIQAEKEKESMRQEVEHVQRLESLGILAGGIAHDFNNLLAAIMGNAELARMAISNNAAGSEYLSNIEKSSLRAADLCKQMLAYAGKGQMHTGPVDLSMLVKESGELLAASINKKTQVKYDLKDSLPFVEADRTQMQQIILNLITNADESLENKAGHIRISTGMATQVQDEDLDTVASTNMSIKDYVFIEVEDNGCGMDAESKEKMFDPFFTTKFTGRGLGLSAALGIVKSQDGVMQVSSQPSKGTRIRVLLPQTKSSPNAILMETSEQDISSTGSILVVDDEEIVRNVAIVMLKRLGFTTLSASNGQEAISIFKEKKDQIILTLLDMTMPIMDGREALDAIHTIKKDAKIILTSGYNDTQADGLITENGNTLFIQKPYSMKVIKKTLNKILG